MSHERIHRGEKPHQCVICQKRFAEKDYLRKHMASHSEGRPHKCTVCDTKAFKTAQNLKAHMRTHTHDGVSTVYACSQCDSQFAQKRSWKKHILTKHPESVEQTLEEGVYFLEEQIPSDEAACIQIISDNSDNVQVFEIKPESHLIGADEIILEVPVDGGFAYTQWDELLGQDILKGIFIYYKLKPVQTF